PAHRDLPDRPARRHAPEPLHRRPGRRRPQGDVLQEPDVGDPPRGHQTRLGGILAQGRPAARWWGAFWADIGRHNPGTGSLAGCGEEVTVWKGAAGVIVGPGDLVGTPGELRGDPLFESGEVAVASGEGRGTSASRPPIRLPRCAPPVGAYHPVDRHLLGLLVAGELAVAVPWPGQQLDAIH